MEEQLVPHLFRQEYGKIVSVLCKSFGISNIKLAEDIASETFLVATETWSLKGVPPNPKAWLYAVAKNKTRDYFKRKSVFTEKIIPELSRAGNDGVVEGEFDWSEENIKDSQLRMIFAVCNPVLSVEAQISLALRVLCGFGIGEIANALLSNKSTINKRLQRAKTNFKKHNLKLILPAPDELQVRQENVLTIIYLLFNEGYYSNSTEKNIRKELCVEAMRLLYLFLDAYQTPEANALMALFCFHASRFEAREDAGGNPILYENQNREKWDQDLIFKGEHYIHQSAQGKTLSKYHLEATIAFWHTQPEAEDTKWEHILQLYNRLLQIEYSPVAALNRTYALSKVQGPKIALKEALKIDLSQSHLYHALLAELYREVNPPKRIEALRNALTFVQTDYERKLLEEKLSVAIKSQKQKGN